MKNFYLTLAFISLNVQLLPAQDIHFTNSGTIEFEKSVNTYALIRRGQISGKNLAGMEKQLLEQYQQSNPQFKVLKSTLTFSNNKTLFIALRRCRYLGIWRRDNCRQCCKTV